MSGLFSLPYNTEFTRDLAFIVAQEYLLRPRIGSLTEMSREYRHIYKCDSTYCRPPVYKISRLH